MLTFNYNSEAGGGGKNEVGSERMSNIIASMTECMTCLYTELTTENGLKYFGCAVNDNLLFSLSLTLRHTVMKIYYKLLNKAKKNYHFFTIFFCWTKINLFLLFIFSLHRCCITLRRSSSQEISIFKFKSPFVFYLFIYKSTRKTKRE